MLSTLLFLLFPVYANLMNSLLYYYLLLQHADIEQKHTRHPAYYLLYICICVSQRLSMYRTQ